MPMPNVQRTATWTEVSESSKLFTMKCNLARIGRNGGWASFLREHHLPRATADQLVNRDEISPHPPAPANCPNEAIFPPATEGEVRKFAQSLLPRIHRVVSTSDAVEFFLGELVTDLQFVGCDKAMLTR